MKNGLIHRTTKHLRHHNRKRFLALSGIIGGLLTIFSLLFGVGLGVQNGMEQIRSKLGVYLYLTESNQQTASDLYGKVMSLRQELQMHGMNVTFSSKDDAFRYLEKRLPHLMKNFQKYDIQNPLPATLYVNFTTQEQFLQFQSIIKNYASIIQNNQELQSTASLTYQQQKVGSILRFTSFLRMLSFVLLLCVAGAIFAFLVLAISSSLQQTLPLIQQQKILGASLLQLRVPFVLVAISIVSIGFVCSWLMATGGAIALNAVLVELTDISLPTMMGVHVSDILRYFLIQCLLFLGVTRLICSEYSAKAIKRIN